MNNRDVVRLGCVLCLTLMSACQPRPKTEKPTLDRVAQILQEKPDKAVLMGTAASIGHSPLFSKPKPEAALCWKSQEILPGDPKLEQKLGRKPEEGFKSAIMQLNIADYQVLPAQPYALRCFSIQQTQKIYGLPGWAADAPVMIDVQPGDVIYYGHVTFSGEKPPFTVTVEDRFEEFAQKYNMPAELKARVQKRLLNLPATIMPSEAAAPARRFMVMPVVRK